MGARGSARRLPGPRRRDPRATGGAVRTRRAQGSTRAAPSTRTPPSWSLICAL